MNQPDVDVIGRNVGALSRPGEVTAVASEFDEYVRLRSDSLVRTACLIVRDWGDAYDAVQDALANVYPKWHGIPAVSRDAYVYRSVTNACLMRLRHRRRITPVAEPDELPASIVIADPAGDVAAAEDAWRLCAELPPRQRAAVVLRFYDDLSYAEIGHALGCAEATARSHVHRALATLRERHLGVYDD